jgi:hypothetical protein
VRRRIMDLILRKIIIKKLDQNMNNFTDKTNQAVIQEIMLRMNIKMMPIMKNLLILPNIYYILQVYVG